LLRTLDSTGQRRHDGEARMEGKAITPTNGVAVVS